MTNATGQSHSTEAQLEIRATVSQTMYAPTAALFVALLAAQYSGAVSATLSDFDRRSSTTQLTSVVADKDELFNELVRFHQRLADAQKDLPEEAARVLRENLWQLYD